MQKNGKNKNIKLVYIMIVVVLLFFLYVIARLNITQFAVWETSSNALSEGGSNNTILDQNINAISLHHNNGSYEDFWGLYKNNIVLWLKLDNNAAAGENATIAYDEKRGLSANATLGNGQLTSRPTWAGNAKVGMAALDFDGVDDFVTTADINNELDTETAITFMAWIYPRDDINALPIVTRTNLDTPSALDYFFRTNAKKLELYWSTDVQPYITNSNVLVKNQWQHVAFTHKNGDKTSTKLYVNGVAVPGAWSGIIGDNLVLNSNHPIDLSRYGSAAFNGLMDDAVILNVSANDNDAVIKHFSLTKDLYPLSGTYESKILIHDNRTNWKNITLSSTNLVNTEIKAQVRACQSESCTGAQYNGPDGTAGTYYTAFPADLYSGLQNTTFFQYKLYLETSDSNRNQTPSIDEISIGYEPVADSGPNITINSPSNETVFNILYNAPINITLTDANNDLLRTYIYAGNSSDNAKWLVYYNTTNVNDYNFTYNLTSLPLQPEPDNRMLLLMHFDNISADGENQSYAHDYSMNGNNAGFGNESSYTWPLWTRDGKFGSALSFDGEDDYINNSFITLGNTQQMTISTWIKTNPSSVPIFDPFAYGDININGSITATFDPFFGNGTLNIYFYNGQAVTAIETPFIPDYEWHNVVAVASLNNISVYYDGILMESQIYDDYEPANTLVFTLGHIYNRPRHFNGSIDEVAVWNRTLTNDEILNNYRLKNGTYYFKVNTTDSILNNETDVGQVIIGSAGVSSIPPGGAGEGGSGGGSGGGGGGTSRTFYEMSITAPTPVAAGLNQRVVIPVKIKNDGQNTLNDINLKASSDSTDIKVYTSLEKITSLKANKEISADVFVETTSKAGTYSIVVEAKTNTPVLADSTVIYINSGLSEKIDPTAVLARINFAQDMFRENPRCEEFNSLVIQAEDMLKTGNAVKALELVEIAIQACNDLIAAEKPVEIPGQIPQEKSYLKFWIILFILLIISVFIVLLLYYRKRKKEHDKALQKEEATKWENLQEQSKEKISAEEKPKEEQATSADFYKISK